MTDHVRHNRKFWDTDSDAYQDAHGRALAAAPKAWGAYRVAESQLNVLGDVAGQRVLELGCGAAQWSMALARDGAHAVGLDLSNAQLTHARGAESRLPLVQASGEQVPFARGAFDVVFCDHGAVSFCDPTVLIPEVARILKPGGRFAFCVTHPLLYLTFDEKEQRQTKRLHMDYRDLGRKASDDGTIDWALPAGAWVRVLRASGFVVDDVIELVQQEHATTTYEDFAPPKWARRWPAEWIWNTHLFGEK